MAGEGRDYEELVGEILGPKCQANRYEKKPRSPIGLTPWGTTHYVDWEIWDGVNPERRALLSCKYQDSGGTAEEKIPYEVIKLTKAIELDSRFRIAWLVIGGDGWTPGLRTYFFTSLYKDLPSMVGRVQLLSTDDLISHDLVIPD